MYKLRQLMKPYTFRARMQILLTLSALAACLISLVCSYAIASYNLRVEMTDREYNIAISMLELEQKTELSLDEIMDMVSTENINLRILTDVSDQRLTDIEMTQLEARTILTLIGSGFSMPVTYVQMKNAIVRIDATSRLPLIMTSFWRLSMIGLSFLVVFMIISVVSAWRIARPVSQMTAATARISEGDFNVQLPEDRNDELGTLMRSFNRMTNALQRTSWLQKDFIASVSHEFRTPIASVKGYARMLQLPGLTEDKRAEYVTMIVQESDRLSRLSDTLLRLTALEQQTAPASLSTFRLDEQVRQVILHLEPVWSAADIELDLDLDPVTLTSDSELLTQVWINLIHNAVKFSERGGLIEISVHRSDMAEFEVLDHGIGMDEETVNRMFDRFFQGDTSRSHEGVGLGLCLVQRILDILGGEIKVRSKPGEGTSIRVRMPLAPASTTEEG